MTNMYPDFILEDAEYIQCLNEEIEKYEKVYKTNIFSEKLPYSIRNTIKSFHQEIKNTLEEMKINLEKAKEQRRLIDEANIRQSREDQGNVAPEGGVPADSVEDAPTSKPQDMGAPPEETDYNWSEDVPGEECSGITDCF